MKDQLIELIAAAAENLKQSQVIPEDAPVRVQVERPRQESHGDFSSNVAMTLTKSAGKPPRVLAEALIAHLPENNLIEKAEIAGPGFINFYLCSGLQQNVVADVLTQKEDFGRSTLGGNKKVNVEFVSANPTGPLHVGHGRGAAYGSVLSSILSFAGYDVTREYYVNDAGRQMDILAVSVWLRYLEKLGAEFIFPSNGYKGEYVYDISQSLVDACQEQFNCPIDAVFQDVPADAPEGDKEHHIDALIQNAKKLLGEDGYAFVHAAGLDSVLEDIQADLNEFNVFHDVYFSEKSLMDSQSVSKAVQALIDKGLVYEKEGAKWFKSTDFEDDKDRVLVRDNGATTYFASDAAYVLNKLERGFDDLVYVLGADHHGYVPRLRALATAFGYDADRLKIPLVQFAVLYRDGKQVQMSTRSGQFVTLRELREDVGSDAARYFYIMRKAEQHLDFDLDLAKSKSNENPVYYIQYAHARICSVFQQLIDKKLDFNEQTGLESLGGLNSENEIGLIKQLAKFPETIESAAKKYEPHLLCYYLRDLAQEFHSYYNVQKFLVEDDIQRHTRLTLLKAIQQVLQNGLSLLAVSAPEIM